MSPNMAELSTKASVGLLDKDYETKSHEFAQKFLRENGHVAIPTPPQNPTHTAAQLLKAAVQKSQVAPPEPTGNKAPTVLSFSKILESSN